MAHSEVDRFEQIYPSADKLIAEAARILVLDLAQYQARYGELPADEYASQSSRTRMTEP